MLGSALMFMTALNVALGLDIAGGLLVDADPSSTYALHTAAFLLAAPAAFAGVAFFVAVAAFAFQTGALPRWSAGSPSRAQWPTPERFWASSR